MNRLVRFFTDTATLAVFDPEQIEHRSDDDADWWCVDFSQVDEIRSGSIALVSLGADGVYQARLTENGLSADERDYAAECVAGLGVEVCSGNVFIGPGECLPGDGSRFNQSEAERGMLCEISIGLYSIDIYAINWFDSPRWWTEDHHPPNDAPADYVITLRPRSGPFAAINSEPRFSGTSDSFLFESSTRQIGPRPGMILTTKVRKGPDGLALKDCGPCHYRATLLDYSQVAWTDTIRFKVVAVDHNAKEMTGEFIETVKST
jgi:hypothetical protein